MIGSRIKSGREFQTVGPATEKNPTAVSGGHVYVWHLATARHEFWGSRRPLDLITAPPIIRRLSDFYSISLSDAGTRQT